LSILVLLNRGADVGEDIGIQAVKTLAVVPLHDAGADHEPEEQTEAGRYRAPGKAGVSLGVEVHDGTGSGEDLA
jgi:hypothetical protein